MIARAALLLALAAPARAEAPPEPRSRWVYSNLVVLRVNPLGLQDELKIGHRYTLYDRDDVLFRDAHASVMLTPVVTPASTRLGAEAVVMPIAVLELGVRWEWIHYFGILDHVQSSPAGPSAPHSDDDIQDGGEAGENYAAQGWQLALDGLLQAKVGPIAARNRAKLAYLSMDLREGDRVWYEPFWDLLLPELGWMLNNDADLLWLASDKLTIGARYTVQHVWYPDDAFAPGGSRATPGTPTHRLGPLVAYTFFDEPGSAFNRPTLAVLANWWLRHRYRTGEVSSQALPYLIVAFTWRGDLTR